MHLNDLGPLIGQQAPLARGIGQFQTGGAKSGLSDSVGSGLTVTNRYRFVEASPPAKSVGCGKCTSEHTMRDPTDPVEKLLQLH